MTTIGVGFIMNDILTAVILAYNRCPEVLITLDKLITYQKAKAVNFKIIVVDNASTDDTRMKVPALYPDISFIKREVNNGISGWNDGFVAVKTKYILVLDDDSHVESGLKAAIDYLEENEDIGILALNISSGSYATKNWIDKSNTIGFIGCGAIIKKTVFDKIGGFSEWLYVSGHEWEYGIRCIDANYKITFFKSCHVVHRSNSDSKRSKRTVIYTTRNEMAIVYKYYRCNRFRLLLRVFLNNLKLVKTEGLLSGYYSIVGGLAFLQLRYKLAYTPVSLKTQNFFDDHFWSTKPTFNFIRKLLGRN